MTLEQIILSAKEKYHEFTGSGNAAKAEIGNAQWARWATDWQEDTAIMTKNPRQEVQATSDSGKNYDVPSDVLSIVSFKFKQNGNDYVDLKYVPFSLMGKEFGTSWEDEDAGVPTAFTFPTQDTFYLHPTPNSTNQGANYILLNYDYRPPVLSEK